MSSLVAVAAVTVAPAGPATAVTAGVQQPGIAITGITGRGESWLGAMQAPNGYGDDVTFCIMVGGDDPVGTTPAGEGMVSDPVLAAVMALHRWDDSPYARAAIGYLTHVRWEEGANGVSAQERKRRYEQYTPQVVKDTANHFLVEAAGFAGPYAAATVGASGSGTRAGDVHGIGVTNGSGGWMGGLPFTATLSGPATFDATGSAAYSGRTASSPLALAWTATGTGQVAFRVTYGEVPRVTLTLVDGAGNVQDLLTYGHRPAADAAEISPPPVPFEAVGRFQPVASSQVASHVVTQGEPLVDLLTVGVAPGDSWPTVAGQQVPVTFSGTAYSTGTTPPATPGAVPPGATVLGTTTLTVAGTGRYYPAVAGVGTGQFVTWVWRMRVAEQPEQWRGYLRGDWEDSFGLPAETTSVRHRGTVTSQVVVRTDDDGRPSGLADDLVVTGFPGDHPGFAGGAGFTADRPTMTQSLWYFPRGVAVSDANRAAAQLLGQVAVPAANGTVPAAGDGRFPLPRTATGAGLPGTYVFTHAFAGDDRVEPFETSVTASGEQFELAPRPLAVTTTAVADRAPVLGDQVTAHDVAVVTGDIPVGATIGFELYEWEAGGPPVCTEPVWTSPLLTLVGEGEVTSPLGDVAALAGDLGFVAVVRDADGTELVRGECGASDETLAAGTYTVGTTASADRAVVPGDRVTVHDVATADGTIPTDATLAFELYQWDAGEEPVCDEPVWVSDPVAFVAGTTRSPDVVVDPVRGDLGFVEVVRGTDGRELSRGECGAAGETLASGTYRVVTAAASDRPAVFGDRTTVWDVAEATGTAPTDATLTFELYTWPTGSRPVCDEPVWASEPVAFVVGTTRSPDVVVDPVRGDLGFVEVVRGTDGRELSRGECGAAGETVVDDVLAVATTARSAGPVVLGGDVEVWDDAVVTGTVTPGTTVAFELYAWPAGDAPVCTAPVWTSPAIPVAGPGAVSSGTTTVTGVAGDLGFVAVVRGEDGRVLARGECGASDETLTAAPPALALTGSGARPLAAVAAGLLLLGAVALAVGRKRRC